MSFYEKSRRLTMIISRCPYRVSFAGGGTDLACYCDHAPGMVLSTTIDRYIWVQISQRFLPQWLIRYGTNELVDHPSQIQHGIIRACLEYTAIRDPLEIVITGDLPGNSGLGSSSALTVGLLAALNCYRGRTVNPLALAQQACLIEISMLRKPIGRQDQYACVFGGLNAIKFGPKGQTSVEPLKASYDLSRYALMFYLGGDRSSDTILAEQVRTTHQSRDTLQAMADLAWRMTSDGLSEPETFGQQLDRGWHLKRLLGCGISNNRIDEAYERAKHAGAWGGKLCGAGGGGFLFVMADPERHEAIRAAMASYRELPFGMSSEGVQIVFEGR